MKCICISCLLQMFLQLSLKTMIYGTTVWDLLVLLVVFFLLLLEHLLDLLNFMLAQFKAHLGYLHLLNAILRWSSSSLNGWELMVLALCVRVLMTLYLAAKLWWLSHCKYKSVCVGFLYTVVMRDLSGCGIPNVSKKGMDPSFLDGSEVNWMCGSKLLRCSRNFLCDAFVTIKVSSTYLFHTLGGYSAVLMALISNSSRGLPLWGWGVTPWLLLVSAQSTCLEIGNMWSSNSTPVGWWCALLSLMFSSGVLGCVPVFFLRCWWQGLLALMWKVLRHQRRRHILLLGAGLAGFDQQNPWCFWYAVVVCLPMVLGFWPAPWLLHR